MIRVLRRGALALCLLFLLGEWPHPGIPVQAASTLAVLLEARQSNRYGQEASSFYRSDLEGHVTYLGRFPVDEHFEAQRAALLGIRAPLPPDDSLIPVDAARLARFFPAGALEISAKQLDSRPGSSEILLNVHAVVGDGEQTRLLLLDPISGAARELPFLGKHPRWSPDGRSLAGTQLLNDVAGLPRFEVVVLNLESGRLDSITADQKDSACNPQWSPDGAWIAYDQVDAQFQSYIDCFPGRGVAAIRWPERADWTLFTRNFPFEVSLAGWIR